MDLSPSLAFCARWLGPRFSTEAVDEFHAAFMDAARMVRARAEVPATAEGMTAAVLAEAMTLVLERDQHESAFWRDLIDRAYDLISEGDPT